eukprot:COSAG06_NODE_44_length_29699_cov_231.744527_27_plen_231_part_00
MELGLFLQIDRKRIVVPSIYTSSLQSPPSLVSLARSSRKTAPSAALPHRQAPNAAARSHRSAAAAGLRSEAPTHPRRWKCSSRPVFAEKNASRFFVVPEFHVMRFVCPEPVLELTKNRPRRFNLKSGFLSACQSMLCMRKQLHVVFYFASHRGQNRGVLPSNFEIGLLKPRQVAELTNRLHAQPCCRSPCCRCACVADGGCGLQEIGLFFQVSLCLSRACLGKRMHFYIY